MKVSQHLKKQAPAGVLRRLPQTRSLMERAMREIYAVARARNIRRREDAVRQALGGRGQFAGERNLINAARHHRASALVT